MDPSHSVSVKELGLSSRALTVLNSAGITTIATGGALKPNWTVTDVLRRLDFGDHKTVILDHPANWHLVFSSQIKVREDHRGVDLISDVLPFSRLW
jgi:hypothetical protein